MHRQIYSLSEIYQFCQLIRKMKGTLSGLKETEYRISVRDLNVNGQGSPQVSHKLSPGSYLMQGR